MKPVRIQVSASLADRLAALPDKKEGPSVRKLTAEEERILVKYWSIKPQKLISKEFGICAQVLRKYYRRLTGEGK